MTVYRRMRMVSQTTELAASLRRLLTAIERGDLDASTPRAIALRRRIDGAVIALEAASAKRTNSRAKPKGVIRSGRV